MKRGQERPSVCGTLEQSSSAALMFLLVCMLSGCSLLNPYVKPESMHPFTAKQPISMPEALNWAEEVRGSYEKALSQHAYLDTTLGVALIPVAAVLTYQGVTGTNPTAIAGTALGGAAILGGGTYLRSPPRMLIYASAISAVNCAVSVIQPLSIGKDELKEFEDDLNSLNSSLGILDAARKGSDPGKPKDIEQVYAEGNAALSEGRVSLYRFKTAGFALVVSVDQIRGAVNKQLALTLPDPHVLATGLGGLVNLPAAPPSLGKPSPKEGQGRMLSDEMPSRAVEKVKDLIAKTGTLREQGNRGPSVEALKACSVDPAAIDTRFVMTPASAEIVFPAGKPSTYSAYLSGGKPPYVALVLTAPPVGTLEANVISESIGYVLRIRTDGKVPPDKYQVVVKDTSQQDVKPIGVEVKK